MVCAICLFVFDDNFLYNITMQLLTTLWPNIIFLLVFNLLFASVNADVLNPEKIVQLTLKNNTKIQSALIDYQLSKSELFASQLDFDTYFTLTPSYTRDLELNKSTTKAKATREDTRAISLGVTQKLNLGTDLEFAFQVLDIKTDDITSTSPKRKQMAAQFKLTQPLLKGGHRTYNEEKMRTSQARLERYFWALRNTIDQEIQSAITKYWDLLKVSSDVEIKKRALEEARETYELDIKLNKLGKLSNIELLGSRAEVSIAQGLVHKLEIDRLDKEMKLKKVIFAPKDPILRKNLAIRSVNNKRSNYPGNFKACEAQGGANFLGQNTNLIKLAREEKERESELLKAKNELLPQLDLNFELLSVGLGTKSSPVFNDTAGFKYPTWEISLNLVLPLGNYSAKGAYQLALAKKREKSLSQIRERSKLVTKSAKYCRKIKDIILSLQALDERIIIEKQKVEIKKKYHQSGRITNTELFSALHDYYDLSSRKIKEISGLQQTIARIQLITGDIGGKTKESFINKLEPPDIIKK